MAPEKRRRIATEEDNGSAVVGGSAGESGHDVIVRTFIPLLDVLNNTHRESQADNRAAANGIIETVTCINFMCHTRLHVELGPLLNFIVGENGSGKSAVLTAITLCLGAKASSTNRGGSLKSFIKEGQEHSTIQVKLKNQGEGAYQPEQYGQSIIVERHFSKNGTSGFKIKSSLGRIISTKRRDVDELVEYFCLQMDNPLNVLSQDNARQFLNASSPALKYKFFVQGVQLEALDNDYKLVMQTADNIEAKLESAADYLIWAQVVEQERSLRKAELAIAATDERVERAERKIQEHSQILEVADESLRLAEENVQVMETEGEMVESQEKAAKDASLERRIVNEERRLAEATGGGRAAKEAELKAANEEVERLDMEINHAGRDMHETQRRLDEAKRAWRLIRLSKPEWSSVIERILGSTPNAFIATGQRDAVRLRNLMKRAGVRNTPVLISTGRPLDLKGKEPDHRYDTILRVLQFEDDLVRDQLIIHHKIEQALLIGSRTDAEKVIFNDRPRNVAFGLCHHDRKPGEGISLIINSRGDQSLDPVRPYTGSPRLCSDDEAQIHHQQGILNHLREELRETQAQSRDAENMVENCQGALKNASTQRQELEKQQAEFRVKHEGEQYGDMAVRKPDLNKRCEQLQALMKEATTSAAQFKVRRDNAVRKAANKADSRKLALSAKNDAFEERDQARLVKDRAVADRDRQQAAVEALDQQARETVGDRVHIAEDATFKSIEVKYKALMAQLEKLERRLGASEHEITERAEKAQIFYETATKEHMNQLQLQQELKQALAERLKRWRSFQRFLSARTRVNFNYLLTMGSSIRCLDEFDVFMDNINRAISTNMLITAARRSVSRQYILITPNAIEGRASLSKDVKIIRLSDPRQRTLPEMQQAR
ncbi:unnamed protein product [Parascedosporium putredinis]|uniref:Rad50/SbcC-type AAA domain-containing protein n=1 Tax=Parascedosporium putredinis TaxID=1442378 RepID=A0A9P1MAR2_9PEZI|nr:unnamed protein product [Parascedosporium putredinis]CAI7994606.1 unnamed protein product [Parascedosporium putredinis]